MTLTTGDATHIRQLTAEGGYMAANEPHLIFGISDGATVEAVNVEWPTGENELFQLDECECWYVLVEGSGVAWKCH